MLGLVDVISFRMAVELHQWIGFILIANFFVWLGFYLFTDKITVYHPDLSPRRHFAGALRQAQYYGYGISRATPIPPRERLPQVQPAAEHAVSDHHAAARSDPVLHRHPAVGRQALRRRSTSGGVRVVDTVHVLIFIFFVTYILVHAYLGALGHTWSAHYKAMLTGYEEVEEHAEPSVQAEGVPQGQGRG